MSTVTASKEAPPKSRTRAAQPAPDESAIVRASGNLKLVADPLRIRILLALSDGERNVTTLCGEMGIAQPAMSHHLALLRAARFVETERRGKTIIYSTTTLGRKALGAARAMMG